MFETNIRVVGGLISAHMLLSRVPGSSTILQIFIFCITFKISIKLQDSFFYEKNYFSGEKLDPNWPCSGPLLQLAQDMADRLLPAFNTSKKN